MLNASAVPNAATRFGVRISLRSMMNPKLLAVALALGPAACAKSSAAPDSPTTPTSVAATAPSMPSAPASAPAAAGDDSAFCGDLGCRTFDDASAAFAVVLDQHPLALGIGEAHAPRGVGGVASATKRFTDDLLPALRGKASFLLVEAMLPNEKCKKETKQVKKQQKPVTQAQAETNQNEYVVLGSKAKALGIVPDLLRPSCDDLRAITEAGASDVGLMLETIARLTTKVVKSELDRNQKSGKELLVISYGGALHNDIAPKPDLAKWSYGPALVEHTKNRYVELDLIVPEYIKDTESWTSLAWYSHYDRDRLGKKTVLFNPRPGSYVIIFPMAHTPD
jgi:hypothetical protein